MTAASSAAAATTQGMNRVTAVRGGAVEGFRSGVGLATGVLEFQPDVRHGMQRDSGSCLARQRRSSRRRDGGVAAGSRPQSGALFSTAASVSEMLSPRNGRSPTSIS